MKFFKEWKTKRNKRRIEEMKIELEIKIAGYQAEVLIYARSDTLSPSLANKLGQAKKKLEILNQREGRG